MKKSKKRNINLKIFIYLILIAILIICSIIYLNRKRTENNLKKETILDKMREIYNESVITTSPSKLFNQSGKEVGEISSNMYLELDELREEQLELLMSEKETKVSFNMPLKLDKLNNKKLGLFKLKNSEYYIQYDKLSKADKKEYDTRYKNYIPFNESIVINRNTKLYEKEDAYYSINEKMMIPIIIKEKDKYFIEFDNKLLYVYRDNVETIKNNNTDKEVAKSLAVLNYHFVISMEAGEDKICEPSSICHPDTQFDSHMQYIRDNEIYSITMKELEMFIDGKINLPKKSVAITIDDGWFVGRAIPILEKYNVMGTLFLIGSLAPASDYSSPNLEVHSHTWNLHNVSSCKEGRSALLCYDKEKIVEDLKKSRESLNNTTYFCYPFYEYNNHAIESLKEAGFTMALTGGAKKVTKDTDKFKVPRYVVYNTTTVDSLSKMIN